MIIKNTVLSLFFFGSTLALAQGNRSSERALVDAVTLNIEDLCEQFQVNVLDAEVQRRIQVMFGHLDLNLPVTDCESLGALIEFSFERDDLKAWSQMGPEKLAQVRAEYSLLIQQLSKRQFEDDLNFVPLSHLQLFEIVILKGFYDGVKQHLQSAN